MQQISEHVYGVMTRMSYVNFYVIAHGATLAIVDTGFNKSDIDRLASELQAQGWSMEQIKHILLTHAHPDHIGGLAALQERSNAHTSIHRLDAPIVRGSQPQIFTAPEHRGLFGTLMVNMATSANAALTPARVDTELNGDEVLVDVLPGLEVVHLPGHSHGQCGFWLRDEGVLIGGDVMFHLPWGLSRPPRAFSPDWEAVTESIRRVAAFEPTVLCLGHGPVVKGNIRDKMAHLL